jgi:hypothetical protein
LAVRCQEATKGGLMRATGANQLAARCLGAVLIAAVASPAIADRPADALGHKTIEELYAAYKEATEKRDWKALFLLSTPERQNADILMLAVSAATSNDATLRRLVEEHGVDWRQLDHAWTTEDNQRLMREAPALAASIGKKVRDKVGLFVVAQSHLLAKRSDLLSTEVQELKNLVRRGAMAVGESNERNTCIERTFDARGNQTGQVRRALSVKSRLWFRQINGHWYLATENATFGAK